MRSEIALRQEGTGSAAATARQKLYKIADLFCGAGSLSIGINDAVTELGHRAHFTAVNHWDIATQTYALNHPGSSVHCVNLDAAFPSHLVPGGKLDLLTGGIECTYFSRARGGKPVTDQQRMSPWHIVRWCTELRVKRVLLENVPEIRKWGPINTRTGKPIKSREGEYYNAFMSAMAAIGHDLDARDINCADHGDPTTRVRWFAMSIAGQRSVPWPMPSHAKEGDLFGAERWRSARDHVIDWSIRGRSIFDRKRPLAPKTLARIAAGMVKFRWPEPFLVVLRQHADARGIDLPLPALCAGGTHIGLVEPFVLNRHGEWRDGRATSIDEPTPPATCSGAGYVIEPFILSQASGGAPRSTGEPIPAAPCGGAHALIAPYYGSGSGETCGSVDAPLPTATTKARFGLVMPVTHNDGSNRARSIDSPVPTLTTAKRGELAFITASFGERPDQAPRVHDLGQPAPTVCATGRVNLVEPGREFDILFRMLEPHELARAMSISTPERPYHFIGNKTEVVRQIGQAVPRRTGKALALSLMGAG